MHPIEAQTRARTRKRLDSGAVTDAFVAAFYWATVATQEFVTAIRAEPAPLPEDTR